MSSMTKKDYFFYRLSSDGVKLIPNYLGYYLVDCDNGKQVAVGFQYSDFPYRLYYLNDKYDKFDNYELFYDFLVNYIHKPIKFKSVSLLEE